MAESNKYLSKPKVRFNHASASTKASEIKNIRPGLNIQSIVTPDTRIKLIRDIDKGIDDDLVTETDTEKIIRTVDYERIPGKPPLQSSTTATEFGSKSVKNSVSKSQEMQNQSDKPKNQGVNCKVPSNNRFSSNKSNNEENKLTALGKTSKTSQISKTPAYSSVNKKENKENYGRSESKLNEKMNSAPLGSNKKKAEMNKNTKALPKKIVSGSQLPSRQVKINEKPKKTVEAPNKSTIKKKFETETKPEKSDEEASNHVADKLEKINLNVNQPTSSKKISNFNQPPENKNNKFISKAVHRKNSAEIISAIDVKKKPALVRSKTQVRVLTKRNMAGSKPNVYVGPGVMRPRTRSLPSVTNAKIKMPQSNAIVGMSGSGLDRPEYNSIIGTISRLQELKKKKIVSDIDHLPPACRSQVLKKVSSALDFPPDKPIFRDLIDLSVNESLLPKRITRSKDPPPRPKDLQPHLSDFFTPQYGKEFVEAVTLKPRAREILDKWDAFQISDLIFNWKAKLDEDNF